MRISLARVDERLIHGQVMTSWVKKCWIKTIILVDDEIVKDDFMKEVLSLSAPQGVSVEVRSVLETAELYRNDASDTSTMLLFKELSYVLDCVNHGVEFDALNIGNIGSSPTRKPFTKEVYLSDKEVDIVKELISKGMYVYIQKLPQNLEQDVSKLI